MSIASRGSGPPPPPQSWYPQSVVRQQPVFREASSDAAMSSAVSPRSGSLSKATSSAGMNDDSQQFPPRPAGSAAASATLHSLNSKSVQEIAEMVKHKEAYSEFLHSLEPIRQSSDLVEDLKESNMDQARKNLQTEAIIAELKNQCVIIRTTELAVAREAFEEAKLLEEGILESRSPARFLAMLQDAAAEADEESENMHRMLLNGEFPFSEFIPNYRNLRLLYHRRILQRLAAVTPG